MGGRGNRGLAWELLGICAAAAFAIAVAAGCAAKARDMSRTAYLTDLSIAPVQTAADALVAARGDPAAVDGLFGPGTDNADGSRNWSFGGELEPCAPGDRACFIRIAPNPDEGLLGSAEVEFYIQGKYVPAWSVTASWQIPVKEGG